MFTDAPCANGRRFEQNSEHHIMLMKNLLIIGARGWGREVLWKFKNHPCRTDLNIKGFLDDDIYILDGLRGEFPPIVSSVEEYEIQPEDVFFCALGDSEARKKYVDIIESKGGHFISYISPQASVYPNAIIGNGSYIAANTVISDNVTVGKHTVIHSMSILGHDVKIGDFVSIEAYSFFGGYAEVGDFSSIHVRSTILRHKKVGSHVSVGAASVVIRNVKDNLHVFGNPAKRID